MQKICFLFLFITTMATAQKPKPFPINHLHIRWQLVSNNYKGEDKFLATMELSNSFKMGTFPASGWTIYFNTIRGVVNKEVGHGLVIEHINGDLFRLRPTVAFKGLGAGQSVVLECVSGAWAFNKSDAPSGYYLVWDDTPSISHNIVNINPIPPTDFEKFNRSATQKNDQITPEMVFEQNRNIILLADNQVPKIFPTPTIFDVKEGEYVLNGAKNIAHDPQFAKEATYLAEELKAFLGVKPKVNSNNLSLENINLGFSNTIEKDGYRLTISKNGIGILASTPTGIFYGIQSLKCLIPLNAWKKPMPNIKLPCVDVKDSPRFGYRGLHMDVARNFQTKEQVKRMLNWMALYKLNTLHFHFSEDEAWRIEIPGLPELTSIGAKRGHTLDSKNNMPASYGSGGDVNNPQSRFYTRADYIELLKYAKARHIEVIPEIETPGHARAAIKAMDARYARLMKEGNPQEAKQYLLSDPDDKSVYRSAQLYNDNVMCVAQPSVYTFIETAIDALVAMHKEADMPLKTIHMGGDEVPAGVWEKSPLCQALLKTLPANEYTKTSDLWLYYWRKVKDIASKRGLYLSGWEEMGMISNGKSMVVNPVFAQDNFHTYVWNTVIGWGTEDLPYRLANAGYKVVLCPVTNMYFDLAYQKDFNEIGYYWGGFLDIDKPFYFIPYDYLKNVKVDRFGNPFDPKSLENAVKLNENAKSNIVGVQGHLWSENIKNAADLEYMAFPKLLALAERAWAADPDWATENDPQRAEEFYQKSWNTFINTVSQRELPRLNYYQGGAKFRIPTVGAKVENGAVVANVQFPSMTIRYTLDGTEPNVNSIVYSKPINAKGTIKMKAFDSKGRGGRSIVVVNK
jgi:hexosaminidase